MQKNSHERPRKVRFKPPGNAKIYGNTKNISVGVFITSISIKNEGTMKHVLESTILP